MSRIIRGQLVTLFALLAALVVTLAACGGGSSAGGAGGGSGSTIAGSVSNGLASAYPAGEEQPVLVALADLLVEPAHAAGVPGVTVELYDATGTALVASTTTDADGRFVFTGLDPGTTYTVSVLGQTAQVTTGNNDRVALQADNDGTMVSIEVASDETQISGVGDDASSDDDDSSADGDSLDDQDSDGESADSDSSDDDSDGQSDDESSDPV